MASPDFQSPAGDGPWLRDGGVLLHIGVHKTGTTAVQAALASARRSMRSQGVAYPGEAVSHYFPSLAVVGQRRGWQKGGQRLPIESWTDLTTEVAGISSRLVVSSEAFCEANEETARRIVTELGGDRVQVVVTLRPLEQLIPSTWQQYVKAGAMVRYDDWLTDVMQGPGTKKQITPSFWKRNDHATLVERWAAIVGPENVAVVVVDSSDRDSVFRSFEELIGLRPGTLVPAADAPSNRSLSVPEVELIRSLNELLNRSMDWTLYNRYIRQGGILDLVEKRRPAADEPRLTVPAWAVERSREIGREAVTRLRASGVHVVGDLEQLVPTDEPAADTPSTTAQVPVDAAVLVLNGVLRKAVAGGQKKKRKKAPGQPGAARTPAAPAVATPPVPPTAWQKAQRTAGRRYRSARRWAGRTWRRIRS